MRGEKTLPKAISTYVALLRGINVGGKNSLAMKDLVLSFRRAGCADVKTYIQSGNVVFEAAGNASEVRDRVVQDLERRHGLRVPIVLRTAAELRSIVAKCPFADPGGEKPAVHVLFLAETPSEKAFLSLDPGRSPPDRFAPRGSEIYLFCPNGLARTKLTNAYFDAKLGTTSTGRNLGTVSKLALLCGEPKAPSRGGSIR